MDRADEIAATDPAAGTTGSTVMAGGLWQLVSRVVPQVYTLVVSVAAARFLGPDGMGRQSFISFVELSLILVLTGGLLSALLRYVAETVGRGRPEMLPGLVRWSWRVQAAAAAIGAAVLAVAALLGAEPTAAWFLAAVSCAFGIQHAIPTAVLIGLQRWRDASIVGLVSGFFGAVATIAVLAAGGGITGIFAVGAAIATVNLVGTQVLARRALRRVAPAADLPAAPADEDARLRRAVARFAGVTSLGILATYVVTSRSEFFFLERYSDDSEIAFYSIVYASVAALLRIFDSLAWSLTPAVATLYGAGAMDRVRSGFGRALRLLLLTSLPLTAAAIVLGPPFLRVVYGREYEATGSVFLITIAMFPLLPLTALATALIEGLGKLALPLFASIAAAVVDIGLAFALVPSLGADGAAIANVGGRLTVGAALLWYAWRLVGPTRLASSAMARTTVASVAAAGAAAVLVWPLGDTAGLIAGAFVGTAVFGALAVALRILPADDAEWLEAVLGARLGPKATRAIQLCAQQTA